MFFFSDLDKTLVCSGYPEHKCVERKMIFEHKENNQLVTRITKDITFMTEEAYRLMQELLQKVKFVPTTMRDINQTMRIDFIRQYNPQFIICSNGCEIYVNGEKDEEWEEMIREEISYKLVKESNDRGNFCDDIMDITEAKQFGGYYFVWKFKDNVTEEDVRKAQAFVPYGFHIQTDNKKMFFLPDAVNKAKAIEYLMKKYKITDDILVAGDSSADKEMLELPYAKAFIPKHSKLKLNRKDVYISDYEYLEGSEDIIKQILSETGINS